MKDRKKKHDQTESASVAESSVGSVDFSHQAHTLTSHSRDLMKHSRAA